MCLFQLFILKPGNPRRLAWPAGPTGLTGLTGLPVKCSCAETPQVAWPPRALPGLVKSSGILDLLESVSFQNQCLVIPESVAIFPFTVTVVNDKIRALAAQKRAVAWEVRPVLVGGHSSWA